MSRIRSGVLWLLCPSLIILFFLAIPNDSSATSQWSRKYKEPCTTCHLGFPRLTYWGERFMRNGFQNPDEDIPDGDTKGKKAIGDRFFSDRVGNWLGVRLNVTPIEIKTDKLTVDGKPEDQVNLGKNNWMQFFVAGSIFKNVSIFIENEFEQDEFKFTWYILGFHNLADTYVNFQVGNLSPVDFTSFPNRLRIIPSIKSDVFAVKSSNGKGEDSVNMSSPRHGIQYYGYRGPLVWYAGIGNGGTGGVDANNFKQFWGGLRVEVPEEWESAFEGSSATFHVYRGTDTANSATSQIENDFVRYIYSANLRYQENLDIQFAYMDAEDDNWALVASPTSKTNYNGYTLVGQYFLDTYSIVLAYDKINSDDVPTLEKEFLSPYFTYFPRENWRISLGARFDLTDSTKDASQYFVNIRTMF